MNMQREHNDLISKIRTLEAENAVLTERVGDTLLYGLVAEIIYQTEDSASLIDQILERISMLKHIPFCACLEQTPNGMELKGFHASFADIKKTDIQISFPGIFNEANFNKGFLMMDKPQFDWYGFSCSFSEHDFSAETALLIACNSNKIPNLYFVFLDNTPAESPFPRLLMLLQQMVQLATERLENIFMFGELIQLNHELDQRVNERTVELIKSNRDLKREIYERKIIERALTNNEQMVRSVYNAAIDVAFITVDLSRKFIVRSFSPGAEKMFGIMACEVLGKSLELFELPNHADLFPHVKGDFDTTGLSHREEIILTRKSGEAFSAILTFYPLYDEDDRLIDVLAVCIDISQLKNTQNELIKERLKAEESETKFRSLFEQASDGIFILDGNGNYLDVNESACEMLGYTKEEMLKFSLDDLIFKDKRGRLKKSDIISEKVVLAERILIRKDGSKLPVEISGRKLADGRTQGIVRNITERKKIEQELVRAKEKAEENDRLKTAFLQNMSHEIRTPMNAIIGFADLMPEYFNDQESLNKFTNIIKQRGNDLLEIIDDILNIAHIESGQIVHAPEDCRMSVLFTEMDTLFQEYRTRINKKNVQFQLRVPADTRALEVMIDQVKLKQVLINLVGNAFKFTFSGKIEVGCNIKNSSELEFYVSDTGIGIPKEKHAEIFNRFMQASHGTSRLYGGTGLGLSIVQGLLDLMGGKIWLESDEGKGSTFTFTLPYLLSNNSVKVQPASREELRIDTREAKVLIVEDDEYNAEYLKEILSDVGISYVHTQYGRKAVEICSEQQIHLVLMDVRLPDITGYDATSLIKKINPKIKIIIQTAYATLDDKEKAFDSGCDDYLSKPIKRDLLVSQINTYLKNIKNHVQS